MLLLTLFINFLSLVSNVFCFNKTENSTIESNSTTGSDNTTLLKFMRCEEVIATPQYILKSPNFPRQYDSNLECEILLRGPECKLYYILEFHHFDVEYSTGCVKDRLEIGDQDALCGIQTNFKTYLARDGSLKLKFISDSNVAKQGYKILITRSLCTNFDEDENDIPIEPYPYGFETTTVEPSVIYPPATSNDCCKNVFNERKMIITSPGFPNTMSIPFDCVFNIKKSNPNVCRLRIRFLFFWLNNNLDDCTNGYFEIDGKKICGCKSDLKVISNFENSDVKKIYLKSRGQVFNSYSGFIMEIIQDDCPYKQSRNSKITSSNLIRPQNSNIGGARILTDYYFYIYPDFDYNFKDTESVSYLDTNNSESFLDNGVDYNTCLNWNQLKFNEIFLGKQISPSSCL